MAQIVRNSSVNKITEFFKKNNYLNLKLLVWLLLIYFPLFLNLGGVCMQKWDEARYADSSYEMLHDGNPFVVTYFHQPSMDSAKPPLMHWLQAFCIALFGFNETSVRLPSALGGLVICFVIMRFSLKKFNSFSFGAIATLVLLGTNPIGFCGVDHSIRTADYDGLLTTFSLLGLMSFYWYNEDTSRNRSLFCTFLFFTLAVLTKAVAGLFFVPGMLIYLLMRGNLSPLLKNKWFYISLGMLVGVVAFVLLMREYYTPGYLQALNDQELLGRHNIAKDAHEGDFWYYIDFIKSRFGLFAWASVLGWIFGMSAQDQKIRRFSIFTFVLCATFYFVLSSSETKLQWYILPLFPLIAIQAGLFVWMTLKYLADLFSKKLALHRQAFFYLSAITLLLAPYIIVVNDCSENSYARSIVAYNNLQEYLKHEPDAARNGILMATPRDSEGQYLFYYYKLNELGFNLKYNKAPGQYKKGDKLIIEDPVIQDIILRGYDVKEIDAFTHLKVYEVIEKKTP